MEKEKMDVRKLKNQYGSKEEKQSKPIWILSLRDESMPVISVDTGKLEEETKDMGWRVQ